MKIGLTLQKFYFVLSSQLGIDPRRFIKTLGGLKEYLRDLRDFKKVYSGELNLMPCLGDKRSDAGAVKNEYFWQDLFIAQQIFARDPKKHIDIGSRLDGFVAHLATLGEVEVCDIRPLKTKIKNIKFNQIDLMDVESTKNFVEIQHSLYDSLSCLHALEHFGLGRYGDRLDVDGVELGIKNMSQLLEDQGLFYLSLPVGRPRVEFNAHRVSDIKELVSICRKYNLNLIKWFSVKPDMGVIENIINETEFEISSKLEYMLGIFILQKNKK